MSKESAEGFDPLRDQANRKIAKERNESSKKVVRKIFGFIIFLILLVAGMYVVGGTGEYSEWKSVRKSLSAFGGGSVSAQESSELIILANGIDSVRGNRSALAGVYSVYALQMLADGNGVNAGHALRVLKKDYASIKIFAELWGRSALTEECKECESSSKGIDCKKCNGRGRISGNKLSKGGGSRSADKACMVCKGTGKVSAKATLCRSCQGVGDLLSPSAASVNLTKALRKSKLLVNLKCLQCVLSLRALFDSSVNEDEG